MPNQNEITDYKVWKMAYLREKELRKRSDKQLDEKTSEVLTSLMILEQQVKKETLKNAELQEANSKLEVAHSQLIQSEKMASLGQLSAGIAHEINNPIAFIRSYLQTLKGDWQVIDQALDWHDQMKSDLSDANQQKINQYYELNQISIVRSEFEECLQESLEGIERIVDIVNQMQSYNRQASNTLTLINLEEPITTAINIANKRYNNEVTLKFNLSETPKVLADSNQLTQVFLNLIVNGIQATIDTENEGEVVITVELQDHSVFVTITDNGVGISEDNLKKIFDPFFTTKPVGIGTGLGMSVAYNILKAHNASIHVTSKLNVGTQFKITLPIPTEDDIQKLTELSD